MTWRLLAYLLFSYVLTVLTGCQQDDAIYKRQILSFGTQIEVTLYGIDPVQADRAILQIEKELDVMHQQWHAWQKGTLTELNQKLISGIAFEADPAILPLIIESQQLYLKSKGLFNPAIGKLIELWGFYRDNPEDNTLIPNASEIKRLIVSNPNMSDILIHGNILTGTNPDLQIDLGGYAKGYGVDRLIEHLKKQGIDNALINAGGDLGAIGQPGTRAWKIAIQDPNNNQPLAWLELMNGESVFSSGNYQRNFKKGGRTYHHIIDPRSGYPSEQAKAVTVVHKIGAIADAAATALMVASANEWFEIAKSMGLKHFLIIGENGQLYADSKFAKRLHLIENTRNIEIIGTL